MLTNCHSSIHETVDELAMSYFRNRKRKCCVRAANKNIVCTKYVVVVYGGKTIF